MSEELIDKLIKDIDVLKQNIKKEKEIDCKKCSLLIKP